LNRRPADLSKSEAMLRSAIIALLLATVPLTATAQARDDLPDIGNPADAVLSMGDEYRIGLMIVRGLRDQGRLVEDPEINEYVQSVGARLAAQTQDGGHRFQFFVVRDPQINAFALPGGFIGINHGLVLATANESELASVLAHEIAHVTQRHIARSVRAQSRQSLASAAAILAGILIGATTGTADAAQAAIAIAQGTAAQQKINFTRANEYEADRVGIGFLAAAGFDPAGMPSFFETMGRRAGLAGQQVPEFFRTHPVTANRIAESRSRASQFDRARQPESTGFRLARERLRVITSPADADLRNYYATLREQRGGVSGIGDRYGEALAHLEAGRADSAAAILRELVAQQEGLTILHASLGQAQMAAGQQEQALATLERAIELFPRNVPLSVRYAEALMQANRPKEAHALLLDLFNVVPPTPAQIRLTALAASAAGDTGDAYYYMSEYHIASGDLALSTNQLELALAAPNLTQVQRERFRARLDEVRQAIASDGRRRQAAREQERPREQ
jgi:predicted Zn-dependent protease